MLLEYTALCVVYNIANIHSVRSVCRLWLMLAVLAALALLTSMLASSIQCQYSATLLWLLGHISVYSHAANIQQHSFLQSTVEVGLEKGV